MNDTGPPRLGFAWGCAVTTLVSAFLLFQVQPLISKMILPWFGGSTAVWTTCMLFFQSLLLGGYAYAHLLTVLRRPFLQAGIHLLLLAIAVLALPINPDSVWKPPDSNYPTWRILLLLLANVGLPYFLLSSTAPLIQTWYGHVYRGRSPYRLYALSNLGSFAALLSYPFLFEPSFTTKTQGTLWSLTFGIFALLCGCLAVGIWRLRPPAAAPAKRATSTSGPDTEETSRCMTPLDRLSWLLLSALGSVMLLAVTNHICQDVAVVPFLWVAPLSLYLLSFVICFDRESWYSRRLIGLFTAVTTVAASAVMLDDHIDTLLGGLSTRFVLSDYTDSLVVELCIFLACLFSACMLCHGELVRRKPPSQHLTVFYLFIAAGGASGGVLVAVISPLVFNSFLELNLGLLIVFVLAALLVAVEGEKTWLAGRRWLQWALSLAAVGGFLVVGQAQMMQIHADFVAAKRNFYGVLRVEEDLTGDADSHTRQLTHGRVVHGVQYLALGKQDISTFYYGETSGIAIAMRRYPRTGPMRVGAVGLGIGTVAALAKDGDCFRFYEINPDVVDLANRHFTYLRRSKATIEIALGDARLSLEREPPQDFDIILLDAFSSDAIPAHLLTKEACIVYLRHLKPQGVLVVHVSNWHLNLVPVVVGLADHFQMQAVFIERFGEETGAEAPSDWILLSNNEDFLNDAEVRTAGVRIDGANVPLLLWTDQYSNLFQILK